MTSDKLDYFENEEKLQDNIELLAAQNGLLGETLKMILVHIGFIEEGIVGSLTEDRDFLFERFRTQMEGTIEEFAKDYASLEADELKRRLNQQIEKFSREMTRYSSRLGRLENDNERKDE